MGGMRAETLSEEMQRAASGPGAVGEARLFVSRYTKRQEMVAASTANAVAAFNASPQHLPTTVSKLSEVLELRAPTAALLALRAHAYFLQQEYQASVKDLSAAILLVQPLGSEGASRLPGVGGASASATGSANASVRQLSQLFYSRGVARKKWAMLVSMRAGHVVLRRTRRGTRCTYLSSCPFLFPPWSSNRAVLDLPGLPPTLP